MPLFSFCLCSGVLAHYLKHSSQELDSRIKVAEGFKRHTVVLALQVRRDLGKSCRDRPAVKQCQLVQGFESLLLCVPAAHFTDREPDAFSGCGIDNLKPKLIAEDHDP